MFDIDINECALPDASPDADECINAECRDKEPGYE